MFYRRLEGQKRRHFNRCFFFFFLTFKGWLATCYSRLYFKEAAGRMLVSSGSQGEKTAGPQPRPPSKRGLAWSQQGQTRAESGLSVNDNIQLLAVNMSHESSCGSQASLVGAVNRSKEKTKPLSKINFTPKNKTVKKQSPFCQRIENIPSAQHRFDFYRHMGFFESTLELCFTTQYKANPPPKKRPGKKLINASGAGKNKMNESSHSS